MEDLWPDLHGLETKNAPITLLREQAALLGEKTKNLFIGRVEPSLKHSDRFPGNISTIRHKTSKDVEFNYDFFIEMPSLGNYRYLLFSISHPIDIYPVSFIIDNKLGKELLDDSEWKPNANFNINFSSYNHFKEFLKKILHSHTTEKILTVLLSQVVT